MTLERLSSYLSPGLFLAAGLFVITEAASAADDISVPPVNVARGDQNGTDDVVAAARSQPSERSGVITLFNGNTIEGNLLDGQSSDVIRWHGTHFVAPFRFPLAAVDSIKFSIEQGHTSGPGEFVFELTCGDIITGRLTEWSQRTLSVRSQTLGVMQVRSQMLSRLYRAEDRSKLIFAGLAGLQDWSSQAPGASDWNEEGDQLWTDKPGATLDADFGVPARAVVEFDLSWNDQPDFVLAIGCRDNADSDDPTDQWSFETVDGGLAIVRERDTGADVELVADLTHLQKIRVSAYLDQHAGQMDVFLNDGSAAGRVLSPTAGAKKLQSSAAKGIRLVNRGRHLKLERFRVSQWIGGLPSRPHSDEPRILLADGQALSGKVQRLDVESSSLVLEGQTTDSAIKLEDVSSIEFDDGTQESDTAQCTFILHGGLRVSGDLHSIDDRNWLITNHYAQSLVRVPRNQVRTMIVNRNQAVGVTGSSVEGRIGRLELGLDKISGRLTSATRRGTKDEQQVDGSCLCWRPVGSLTASRLRWNVSGRIVYRESSPSGSTTIETRALELQQLRQQQQKRGLNFGELFLERVDNAKSRSALPDAHFVHLRSGDRVACRIESIDARGIRLSTTKFNHVLVPHANMRAIELVRNSPPPDLIEAKRTRLLTIPRLQKPAPPTHLICSHNGDFLRCRLLSLDADRVRLEVQFEEIEIPRDRVAQIIWFHPEETSSSHEDDSITNEVSVSNSPWLGCAQVLQSDGERFTLDPSRVTEEFIEGTCQVRGLCRFDLSKVDQLILGRQIDREVADLGYNRWRLQSAAEPLVAKALASEQGDERQSDLIGRVAPDFNLKLLSGGEIQLSACKGEIVLLDFWATWCARCIETMPQLEKAIRSFDPTQLRLLSINVEETPNHVRSVLARYQMNPTVALDTDGSVAASYGAQIIPQLVIIGPDGKVLSSFHGGGTEVIEKVIATINQLLPATRP